MSDSTVDNIRKERHLPNMDYARFRQDCLPIGSGVTEAACKTVVKQRLCGSRMKWKHSGAATVLGLRSLILTKGRWDQFWSKIDRFGFQCCTRLLSFRISAQSTSN